MVPAIDILVGPNVVGKSMIAQNIAHQAVMQGYSALFINADLLFDIINRRYELKPTIVITNRPFAEWSEVFPNATSVVSIVDRLVHHSAIMVIEGGSYRMREAKERAASKKRTVKSRRKPSNHPAPKQPS